MSYETISDADLKSRSSTTINLLTTIQIHIYVIKI